MAQISGTQNIVAFISFFSNCFPLSIASCNNRNIFDFFIASLGLDLFATSPGYLDLFATVGPTPCPPGHRIVRTQCGNLVMVTPAQIWQWRHMKPRPTAPDVVHIRQPKLPLRKLDGTIISTQLPNAMPLNMQKARIRRILKRLEDTLAHKLKTQRRQARFGGSPRSTLPNGLNNVLNFHNSRRPLSLMSSIHRGAHSKVEETLPVVKEAQEELFSPVSAEVESEVSAEVEDMWERDSGNVCVKEDPYTTFQPDWD